MLLEQPDKVNLIINRCKKGDRKAFFELYSLFAKNMLNVSYRIVNNKEEAEDILQESFIKVFENIRKFDEKTSFGAWFKRVIVNHSIDVIRKRKMLMIPLDETKYLENEETEEHTDLNIETIRECIQYLPDGYRIILTLYLFEGYSHREIGDLLKISEGTSKSQYSRSKSKLIKLIKEKTNINER